MPYVAQSLDMFRGKKAGDGSAIALLENAARTPPSHMWRPGPKVLGTIGVTPGTAIAIFNDGHYGTSPDCHAALFISQDGGGMMVLDQGDGYPASESLIPDNGTPDSASRYFIIE